MYEKHANGGVHRCKTDRVHVIVGSLHHFEFSRIANGALVLGPCWLLDGSP